MNLNEFTVTKLSEHLYRIVDALEVACYLVVGEKRACLLDTCTGVGNIKSCVESITDLPLTVVISHGHMDHCGGAGWFEKAYMSHSEFPVLEIHKDIAYRCSFFNSHLGLELKEKDFRLVPTEIFLDIPEDMELDLGGVTVKLLLAKGHTPGMICPLILEDRALIIGDACDDNVVDCCGKILEHKDAHIPTKMLGAEMYSCCEIGADGLRLDGKTGNVLYSDDKVDSR